MNRKFLVSFTAILAILSLLVMTNFVSAIGNIVTQPTVTIKGADIGNITTSDILASFSGETVPIKVVFKALENDNDVRIKAWISGFRSELSTATGRFDIFEGGIYSQSFVLQVPSEIDPTEDYTLIIRFESKTNSQEFEYHLRLQRESYDTEFLSAETPQSVSAGSSLKINTVLKNRGLHNLDDLFVIASIPALNTQVKVYFGDLTPQDKANPDKEDAVERDIYLPIPSDAKAGTYTLQLEAYNLDTVTSITKTIVVSGTEGQTSILAATSSKTFAAGEDTTYEIVIVNNGNKVQVFNVMPAGETAPLTVSLDQSVVAVPAGSSQVVKVNVKASNSAEEGTYAFALNVNSNGELIKTVNFSANVSGAQGPVTNTIVILTVVLAIIFVVLLIVLIVLLTRKPEKIEGTEESYY